MKTMYRGWQQWLLSTAVLGLIAYGSSGQVFTIQVGTPPPPPMPLVSHADTWRYHKGTTAPVIGWQTNADATLDASWSTGAGGFGYSDLPSEVALCQTLLPDMLNGYTTLYIRRSFEITNAIDPTLELLLTMDWDDGFVAYLDGAEIARDRARTAVGVEPPNTDTASSNHESSRGTSVPVNPPMTYPLGAVGSRLQPGTHVLAILGLNGAPNSSDFVLIPDLSVGEGTSILSGPLFALVKTNSVMISGTNTIPNSARVVINGSDAEFNAPAGTWTRMQLLAPGFNRLTVEVFDTAGVQLFVTNRVVISELSTTFAGGTLGEDTLWDSSLGIIRVTNNITVPPGGVLTIAPGAVALVGAGLSIRAGANAALNTIGNASDGAYLLSADAATMWGEIAADGASSMLTMRHAETIGGNVKFRNGASGLMEDCYIHDFKSGSVPIAGCTGARQVTVRRCHFRTYHETLWQTTLMTIEDSLFEMADNPSSDALDFDGAPPGSVIRRCTFRHGPQSNTDAIDIGPFGGGIGSTNTIIEDSLMFDFPNDKGVSIGEGSYGIVVRNCLIYGTHTGIEVKDSPGTPPKPPCTANIYNCTIANCNSGFHCFNKSDPSAPTGGGQITNSFNNILWGNLTTVDISNSGFVIADHSDFAGTNWPGDGNIDLDPLFVNAAQRDYRLAVNSPCIGTGRNGETMGPRFPVGAPMALSHPRIESVIQEGATAVVRFWADSEKSYSLLYSDAVSGGTWLKVADIYPHPLPREVTVTNAVAGQNRFYRLVSPRQP